MPPSLIHFKNYSKVLRIPKNKKSTFKIRVKNFEIHLKYQNDFEIQNYLLVGIEDPKV